MRRKRIWLTFETRSRNSEPAVDAKSDLTGARLLGAHARAQIASSASSRSSEAARCAWSKSWSMARRASCSVLAGPHTFCPLRRHQAYPDATVCLVLAATTLTHQRSWRRFPVSRTQSDRLWPSERTRSNHVHPYKCSGCFAMWLRRL